ncbi:MAG: helix-turn-helix domain-containing protein [Bacteroides sp.]|nr:helix-turn-helix domain-containing protein [Eubacterium sp.]MCM1417626.1 helix-turn-helix domain-containing protein [Roseburia sp.]MCM1461662.1 helix-turn-helix domain-containing protein [Bacteroides sp.]
MRKNKYPKRDPIKDYFPLPNEIFCLNLSYGEIAVYSYLLYRENRKTFQCYPSYRSIGKALNMSRNTVCKYVRQLEEKELIATEPTNVFTKDGKKLNGNLLYTILPIEQAKRYFYDRQLENADRIVAEEKRKQQIKKLCLKPDRQAV